MRIEIKSKDSFVTTQWSGGTTTEMFLLPSDGSYEKRDFKVRISSASVEKEVTVFSRLEGIQRYLSVLHGSMILTFNDSKKINVKPYDVIEFNGLDRTISEGLCTDFNLMLKDCEGKLFSLKAGNGMVTCRAGYSYIFYSEFLCSLYVTSTTTEQIDDSGLQDSYSMKNRLLIVSEIKKNEEIQIFVKEDSQSNEIVYVLCAEIKYEE